MVYGAGTLVSRGKGRDFWNDFMTVKSCRWIQDRTGRRHRLQPTYTAWLTAWLYDSNGEASL